MMYICIIIIKNCLTLKSTHYGTDIYDSPFGQQQKAIFDELCAQFGMSANTAINIFVKAVIRCRKIPFTISADSENDIREKALNVFNKLRADAENSNEPEMTLDEINAEINEVRRLRKERNNGVCGN